MSLYLNRIAVAITWACLCGAAAGEPFPPVRQYHEPEVRYILADIQLGGSVDYYRNWVAKEHDPDSARAVKEWEAGTRVSNIQLFERKDVKGKSGFGGKRICLRGTNRTAEGAQIVLSSDLEIEQAIVRYVLAELTLGGSVGDYINRGGPANASTGAAVDRWRDGVRATNTASFEVRLQAGRRTVVYKGTDRKIDGAQVRLNSDPPYDEAAVRYILADICLGGGAGFYQKVVDTSHDPHSAEALARWESGYTIVNLADLERKQVAGKTLITAKGSDERINGLSVKLSSDPK